MKVHFACSTSELGVYSKNYIDICNIIRSLGHTITRDWIYNAVATLKDYKAGRLKIDRTKIYDRAIESLLSSDFVVIEGTVSSFSIGHQVTLSISKNKPTLFLIYNDGIDHENKYQNNFIHSIKSTLLRVEKYSSIEDLNKILSDFLNNNKNTATKFNIVLNREIENYLDWASFFYKVNKSEFIREVLNAHMRNIDKEYRKYLSK